ncbi:MAG: ABC transporter ATP-binding protein [Calditrichaeota bacterium]|nr:ABC transporter ATP-binding protein [Calditrichota bacterium]
MNVVLELAGVGRRYGEHVALDDVSLQLCAGEILGLIGPDGAGKTTLLRISLGLLHADNGRIRLLDYPLPENVRRIKARTGYMPQRFSLYPDLTVLENLRFFAALYQVPKSERANRETELLAFSRLAPFTERLAGRLSGGMKQKLALACNLIHRPEVLFLDEPTTGVDPVSRREFWDVLRGLARDGISIMVSTPYMDEAELCDRVALMRDGRIMMLGPVPSLTRASGLNILEVATDEPLQIQQALLTNGIPAGSIQRFGEVLHLRLDRPLDEALITGALQPYPCILRSVDPSLEDIFIYWDDIKSPSVATERQQDYA